MIMFLNPQILLPLLLEDLESSLVQNVDFLFSPQKKLFSVSIKIPNEITE